MTNNISPPDWFDIRKYDNLKSLSSKELCKEVKLRQVQKNYVDGTFSINLEDDFLIEEKDLLLNLCRKHGGLKNTIGYLTNPEIEKPKRYSIFSLEYAVEFFFDIGNWYILTRQKEYNSVAELSYNDIENYFAMPSLMCRLFVDDNTAFSNYPESLIEAHEHLTEYYNSLSDEEINSLSTNLTFPSGILGQSAREVRESLNMLFSMTPFFDHLPSNLDHGYFKIDLSSPNEVIVSELIEQINELREIHGVFEETHPINVPKDNEKSGGKRFMKSLVENRVIPYIDLFIWSIENDLSLTNGWFMSVLFSDHLEKSMILPQNKMSETIKPSAQKWMDSRWLNTFYKFDIEPLEFDN